MSPLPVRAVYGLRIASDFPFRHPLPTTEGPPDLRFVLSPGAPPRRPAGTVLWTSDLVNTDGEPAVLLSEEPDHQVLRFLEVADFHFTAGHIEAVPFPGASREVLELRFLGPVLAYHLERAGVLALHASAVVLGGRAVAFAASNHGGKSSLAAALMQQGHPLLTDDVLPVEGRRGAFVARPGYPQMRFWPAEAARFSGADAEHLPRAHPGHDKRRLAVGAQAGGGFGTFHPHPVPLAAVVVPQRRPGATSVRLQPLPPAEATVALLGCSFIPRLAAGAGLQPARLGFVARLVERVPVLRLVYPDGFEHLPAVAEVVRDRWTAR